MQVLQRLPMSLHLLLITSFLIVGCNGPGSTILPPADCPTMHAAAKPDWGPVAPQAAGTNIDIELSPNYVADRIIGSLSQNLPSSATQQQLNIPAGQPGSIPKAGADITSPGGGALLQEIAGPPKQNILYLVLTPWLRKDDPQPNGTVALSKAPLPYSFNLFLFLIPHLITPQTVPDLGKRQSLLQCGSDPNCSGVLLSVDLDKLSLGTGPIYCTTNPPSRSPDYNFIQQQVLQGLYDQLYGTATSPPLAPIKLPSKPVTEFVSGILGGSPVNLTGVALGSNGFLKLGLTLDQGTPHTFDSQFFQLIQYFDANDWGINIDTTIISAAIQSQAVAAAQGQNVTLNVPLSIGYQRQPGEGIINISATGHPTNRTCVPVSISDTICPKVCKDSGSPPQSALVSCPQPPATNVGINLCTIFYVAFGQGMANAQVCVGGPCPPPSACTQLGGPIQFLVGPGDTFYATDVVTDMGFYISGRSTMEDAIQKRPDPRTSCASLPISCP